MDLVFVRELTGGIYFGEKRRDARSASDLCTYTVAEIERIVRVAAQLARTRRRKLTSIDKSNVLETSRLWREVAQRVVHAEFPDVALEHMLVDSAAMHLIRRPRDFDVIVTENMFGDILTDEAAMLAARWGCCRQPRSATGGTASTSRSTAQRPTSPGADRQPLRRDPSAALLLRHSLKLERRPQSSRRASTQPLTAGVRTADMADGAASEHAEAGPFPSGAAAAGAGIGAAPSAPAPPFQAARQVLAQVLQSLDPHRQADQPVGKSRAGPRSGVHRRVRHGGRVRHQALHPA